MPRQRRAVPEIWLIVQNGGSSREWYSSTYDTLAAAEAAIIEIKAHTYDAIGPYRLPEPIARLLKRKGCDGELIEMIDAICGAVSRGDFSELEPGAADYAAAGHEADND